MIPIPQLSTTTAEKVAEATSLSGEPIPEDMYLCVLKEEVTSEQGAKGPYWKWTFEIIKGEHKGRRLWTNTSLNENALWKLKEVFEAFGVSADTNTDDLIGHHVKIHVVQRIIPTGKNAGEIGNEVKQILPAGDSDGPADAAKKAAEKGEPVLF